MTPVITHPERNRLLRARLDSLEEWARLGCLLQVTAQSFTGQWGHEAADFCDTLLRRDLVHIVASDAHDTEHRPPRLDEAFDLVARRYGDEDADRLFVTNPAALIEGTPIPAIVEKADPVPEQAGGKPWYRFWS
jgi:protein-tyrosine phosphatase